MFVFEDPAQTAIGSFCLAVKVEESRCLAWLAFVMDMAKYTSTAQCYIYPTLDIQMSRSAKYRSFLPQLRDSI